MVRFAASPPALTALVALHLSRTGLRLSDLARLASTAVSTMQRAIGLLMQEGIVERQDRRYLVSPSPRMQASLVFAMAFLPQEALTRALSANRSVELAGVDASGIVVVTQRFPEPLDEARLRSAIGTLRSTRPEIDLELVAHHDLRQRVLADASLRDRVRSMAVVAGDAGRYPTPVQGHGPMPDRDVGRGSPSFVRPSASAMRTFAKNHGLRRVVVFGSAARGDLRPSSDIDLLVETASGAKPGAFELTAMVSDAERLFDRDVDILVGQPEDLVLREAIMTEGVVLHDAG